MYYLPQWKKDPNLIITVMWMQIVEHLTTTTSRPSILWLQLDNCFRENKNNFLYGFLTWLLASKIFTEVMCSYLMVGHTHNNLDQVFSTAAIYQDYHSVFLFTHLAQSLCFAYKKEDTKPSGAFLPTVLNWIGFLAPFIKTITGISTPHVFLLRRLDEGRVGLKAKAWHSTTDKWQGGSTETEEWWYLMDEVPPGFPVDLQPELLENYPDARTLSAMETYMTPDQYNEWVYVQENNKVPDELMFPLHENFRNPVQVYLAFTIPLINNHIHSCEHTCFNLFLILPVVGT